MKNFIITIILLLCMLNVHNTFAQRKQLTKEYSKNTSLVAIPSKLTYSYIIGEDGANQKDGSLSIQGSLSNMRIDRYPYTFTINGSYSVKANYSKGWLHGAMSVSQRLPVTKYSRSTGTETMTQSISMTGNFANGQPNGAFNVKYSEEWNFSAAVNYKNGILVGPYSVSCLDDDSKAAIVKGTLTQDGKLNGTWQYEISIDKGTMQFQNGVLISKSTEKNSTKPSIAELSKKYASKQITPEELLSHGCVVRKDSLLLGDYARIMILGYGGVVFEDLGGYDFTIRDAKVYEYLEELIYVSDEGVNDLIPRVVRYYEGDVNSYSDFFIQNQYDELHGCILKEDSDKYYVQLARYALKPHQIKGDNKQNKAYITKEQIAYLEEKVNEGLQKNAITFKDCVYNSLRNYDTGGKCKSLADFLIGKDTHTASPSNESYYSYIIGYAEKLYEKIDHINNKGKPSQNNDQLIEYNPQKHHKVYIKKESIDEIKNIADSLQTIYDNELERIEKEKEARLAAIKKLEEDSIKSIFNYLVTSKTALAIAYGEQLSNFIYTSSTNEFWTLDFNKKLKELCPIIAYEIIEIKDNEIICTLTKQGKKKTGNPIYKLTLQYQDGKVCAESFDINKAEIVENN